MYLLKQGVLGSSYIHLTYYHCQSCVALRRLALRRLFVLVEVVIDSIDMYTEACRDLNRIFSYNGKKKRLDRLMGKKKEKKSFKYFKETERNNVPVGN